MLYVANTEKELEKIINEVGVTKAVVVMDFFADWCAPCKMLGEQLKIVDESLGDDVCIIKINVDGCKDTTKELQIQSIPTLIIGQHSDSEEVIAGVRPAGVIIEKIKERLK